MKRRKSMKQGREGQTVTKRKSRKQEGDGEAGNSDEKKEQEAWRRGRGRKQ